MALNPLNSSSLEQLALKGLIMRSVPVIESDAFLIICLHLILSYGE